MTASETKVVHILVTDGDDLDHRTKLYVDVDTTVGAVACAAAVLLSPQARGQHWDLKSSKSVTPALSIAYTSVTETILDNAATVEDVLSVLDSADHLVRLVFV